jgi:predicted molibdopterin-dependent oxidoreductase YjgC
VINITVDGKSVEVDDGTNLAATLLNIGVAAFRTSVTHEPRQPLCGMGVCFECRVTIDGEPHQRSCLVTVREGMNVITGG